MPGAALSETEDRQRLMDTAAAEQEKRTIIAALAMLVLLGRGVTDDDTVFRAVSVADRLPFARLGVK